MLSGHCYELLLFFCVQVSECSLRRGTLLFSYVLNNGEIVLTDCFLKLNGFIVDGNNSINVDCLWFPRFLLLMHQLQHDVKSERRACSGEKR